jgi:hypothetical protein
VPRFSFLLDDVSSRSDGELAARTPDVVVRLTWAALREARRSGDVAAVALRLGRLIGDVFSARDGWQAYTRVVHYLLSVARTDDPQPFFEVMRRVAGERGAEVAMGLLDTLVERGRQAGREEGRQAGREEGRQTGRDEARRETLLELLQARFGAHADAARDRVLAMDPDAIGRALPRVVSAARL